MADTSDSKLHVAGDMGAAYLAQVSADIRSAFHPQLRTIPATLMLMPLTPQALHVYWQLNDHLLALAEGKELLFCQLSPEDPDERCRLQFEIPLTSQQASCQRDIQVPNQACDYIAELGFRDSHQRFISLLKSNRVHTSTGQPRRSGPAPDWTASKPNSSSSRPHQPVTAGQPTSPGIPLDREQEIDRQIRNLLHTMGYFSGPEIPGSPFSSAHPPATSASGQPGSSL